MTKSYPQRQLNIQLSKQSPGYTFYEKDGQGFPAIRGSEYNNLEERTISRLCPFLSQNVCTVWKSMRISQKTESWDFNSIQIFKNSHKNYQAEN